jgi:hypothetical protein
MNHEYVVFEEMMDAPDFILEQLKIFFLQEFRNGTQVYPIKLDLLYVIQIKLVQNFLRTIH